MIKEVKRGEIYVANLSPARGSEQFGIRPVVIIQNDNYNTNSPTTIIAPLTGSKSKPEQSTHVHVMPECLKEESLILLEQIRTVDKSRLVKCIGCISKRKMRAVDQAIVTALGVKKFGGICK